MKCPEDSVEYKDLKEDDFPVNWEMEAFFKIK